MATLKSTYNFTRHVYSINSWYGNKGNIAKRLINAFKNTSYAIKIINAMYLPNFHYTTLNFNDFQYIRATKFYFSYCTYQIQFKRNQSNEIKVSYNIYVCVTNCKRKHCLRLFTHPFLLIHTWFQKISTWQMLKINEDPQDNKWA